MSSATTQDLRRDLMFGDESLLVGSKSAGKSTIIAALRASAQMMRQARHRSADRLASTVHGGVRCYGFSSEGVQLVSENLRHEFRKVETQIEVSFKGGASLTAVWPVDEDDPDAADPEPFFILRDTDKVILHRPKDVKRAMPDVAVVPSLGPVEHEERILDPEYVRSQMSGRLANRHFRNHLYLLAGTVLPDAGEDELTSFISWAEPWVPGLVVGDLVTRQGDKGRLLDLFCKETGSHTDRRAVLDGGDRADCGCCDRGRALGYAAVRGGTKGGYLRAAAGGADCYRGLGAETRS